VIPSPPQSHGHGVPADAASVEQKAAKAKDTNRRAILIVVTSCLYRAF
jgi:hypothetical protein